MKNSSDNKWIGLNSIRDENIYEWSDNSSSSRYAVALRNAYTCIVEICR